MIICILSVCVRIDQRKNAILAEENQNLDCNHTFPINLASNSVQFDAKSIGKFGVE